MQNQSQLQLIDDNVSEQQIVSNLLAHQGKEVNFFCATKGMEMDTATFRALHSLYTNHAINVRTVVSPNGKAAKLYKIQQSS